MSSGNGDGEGFFDNLVNVESLSGGGNFFENLGNDFLNHAVQRVTMGLVGVEDGKFSNGVVTNVAKKTGKATVSGLKEVTGAKAAEAANDFAIEQFEETKAAAEKERFQAQSQLAADQVKQSQMAGAARNASSRSTPGGSLILGDEEKDFLGI